MDGKKFHLGAAQACDDGPAVGSGEIAEGGIREGMEEREVWRLCNQAAASLIDGELDAAGKGLKG